MTPHQAWSLHRMSQRISQPGFMGARSPHGAWKQPSFPRNIASGSTARDLSGGLVARVWRQLTPFRPPVEWFQDLVTTLRRDFGAGRKTSRNRSARVYKISAGSRSGMVGAEILSATCHHAWGDDALFALAFDDARGQAGAASRQGRAMGGSVISWRPKTAPWQSPEPVSRSRRAARVGPTILPSAAPSPRMRAIANNGARTHGAGCSDH